MATRSAAKAHRQSLKRRMRNRAVKSETKTAVKRAGEAIAAGDPDAARDSVRKAIRALDMASSKGVLHPNNVARRKSRLILKYNAAVAAIQSGATEAPAEEKKKPAARKSNSRTRGKSKK